MIKLKDCFIWTYSYPYSYYKYVYVISVVDYLALYKNNRTEVNTLSFYKL